MTRRPAPTERQQRADMVRANYHWPIMNATTQERAEELAAKCKAEIAEIMKPREIKNHSPADMLEAAVCAEIEEMLLGHPRVFFAQRFNSGEAKFDDLRVRFWRWVKRPPTERVNMARPKILMPDYQGLLTDGRTFALEAKERTWHMTPSDWRSQAQQRYIDAVISRGGVGGIVTGGDQAKAILK